MSYTDLVEHKIDVGDAPPIKSRPYRVSQTEREIISEQVREMLAAGVVRISSSPWSNPVVLVVKKGEVDYLVKMGRKEDIVHVNRILPYHDPWVSTETVFEIDEPEGDEVGKVDKVDK